MRLQNKVAVITGGSRGIGKETCQRFACEGAQVAIWDLKETEGARLVRALEKTGGTAIFCPTNVADEREVKEGYRKTLERFGRVDILVNNAGITRDGLLVKMETTDWHEVLDVNLTGVFNCTKAAAPAMVEQASGCIINTTSVVGVYGNIGQTNYAATKAGLIGLTKTWAKELGQKGVRVNAVAPGFIATPMTESVPEKILQRMRDKTPLGRLGEPGEVAGVYVFLASDEASFINGAIVHVDGGLVL